MANLSIRLHLEVGGHWRPFINNSEVELHKLTTRPLKWLRYLGWCIHGQPGELRATVDGTQVQDDHLPNYYYVSPSTYVSDRITSFRQDVVARDGRCIVSQSESKNCVACHIVPYCKGDEVCCEGHILSESYIFQYMECLSSHREAAPVLEIGDIRNGVLLYSGLHRAFGTGEIAFLLVTLQSLFFTHADNRQTPNPYLLTICPIYLCRRRNPVSPFST
ncbi:hypothetical protein GGX14DRAFT_356381 [Mycena pura]|uniref:HNH nuclease domain-containing protein n=1 Tax=Mycena pura TaxID=153505 RepID=A0AAD6VT43_9AGAR|nr:hypothetical protein GGX14DRAFT_356381 [Mycena pura]